jgi:hypothetical protein
MMLMMLAFAVPTEAQAYGTGTCANRCGSSGSDGTCWCDTACSNYGDCCNDIGTYCGGGGMPTCSNVCNSSSDCAYQCPKGDGTNSYCGHYTCYTPEESRDVLCSAFCDSTSDCNAQCTTEAGSYTTCGAVSACFRPPSYNVMPSPSEPCTESGSGYNWQMSCNANSSTKRIGGSTLGMDGWVYYSSLLSISTATGQAGARARFYIAGKEIGSASNPALDAYALVRPLATDCKNGQTGVYLKYNNSVVWKKVIDKTCLPVGKLTQLAGGTCPEKVMWDQNFARTKFFDSQIPGAKISFSFTIKGITAAVSAEARAQLYYAGNLRVSTAAVNGKLTPEAVGVIAGSGKVGVDAFLAKGFIGIEASTNIVDYEFPNTVDVTVPYNSTINTRYVSSYIHKGISYELKGFLEVGFLWYTKVWKHKLGGGTITSDAAPKVLIDRNWNYSWDGFDPLTCSALEANYNNYWPTCGDGYCNGSETSNSCPSDCGYSGPVCGDGICEAGEGGCYSDCGGNCGTRIICDPM